MRIVGAIFALFAIAGTACAQTDATLADSQFRVRKLTIVADGMSRADLDRIAHPVEGRIGLPEAIEDDVRQSFRDQGYYYVVLHSSKTTVVPADSTSNLADVSVHVEPGDRYTVGEVKFEGNSEIAATELTKQFAIPTSSIFGGAAIDAGIDRLQTIYLSRGFVDFTAIPQPHIDTIRHVADLTVVISEGKSYKFGNLILGGVQPNTGTVKALQAAWKTLQGKTYSPEALKAWVAQSTANLPKSVSEQIRTDGITDSEKLIVDIRMEFPLPAGA
jgi:outer membrane protein assembly factor BamA